MIEVTVGVDRPATVVLRVTEVPLTLSSSLSSMEMTILKGRKVFTKTGYSNILSNRTMRVSQ